MTAQEQQSEIVSYKTALASFDWTYQFSDDHRVHTKNHDTLLEMYKQQAELDPTGEIWLTYSNKHGKMAIPQPRVQNV